MCSMLTRFLNKIKIALICDNVLYYFLYFTKVKIQLLSNINHLTLKTNGSIITLIINIETCLCFRMQIMKVMPVFLTHYIFRTVAKQIQNNFER